MDPVSLAAGALSVVLPYLLSLGKSVAEEGAKTAGESAGKSVFEWIKGKLTSASGKEAVEELEKAPGEPLNQEALNLALLKLLKNNPETQGALQKLLPAGAVSGGLTANVSGSGNKVGQADRGGSVSIK